MTDFITLVNRVEDEIKRTTLNSQVRQACLDAIAHHEQEREFWFNTERSETNMVFGQKFYPTPDDFVDWIGHHPLQITVNQSTYPLTRRSWDYLQLIDLDAIVGNGIPFDWAYGDKQIRLYPIPQDTYQMHLYYKSKLAAITNDSDTNAWLTDGEQLIRARAKWMIYTDIIHQYDKADRQKQVELEAERRLRGLSTRLHTSGKLMAHYL